MSTSASPMDIGTVRPFQVDISKEEIAGLQARLRDARLAPSSILPDDNPKKDRGLLPPPQFIEKFRKQWSDSFDFDAFQSSHNAQPQYLVDIDWCKPLHFIHRPSSRPDAIPLMLIHGWPGTAFEFGGILDRLAEPPADSQLPAFHVVAPSLPGFLWSKGPPSRTAGTGDAEGYCKILDALMVDVLGYKQYAAQGGDWGSVHARLLGAKFARPDGTGCRAVHLNFCPTIPRGASLITLVPEWVTNNVIAWLPEDARKSLLKLKKFSESMAYYWIQQMNPTQLGVGLTDSAVGLLSWLGYFYMPQLGRTPTLSEENMLSICSLYWFTRSISTSFLPYHNNRVLFELHSASENYLKVPFAFTDFPLEIANTTEGAARRTGNLVAYSRATRGGHFAALEEPEIFVNHIRRAFAPQGKLPKDSKAQNDEEELGFVKHVTSIRGGLWDAERRKTSSRL